MTTLGEQYKAVSVHYDGRKSSARFEQLDMKLLIKRVDDGYTTYRGTSIDVSAIGIEVGELGSHDDAFIIPWQSVYAVTVGHGIGLVWPQHLPPELMDTPMIVHSFGAIVSMPPDDDLQPVSRKLPTSALLTPPTTEQTVKKPHLRVIRGGKS